MKLKAYSPHSPLSPNLQLPDSLRLQFTALRRRLWRSEAGIALSGILGSLILSFALVFGSDRLWDTPRWLRLIFTSLGFLSAWGFTFWWWIRWLWKRRDSRDLASLVQKHYGRLGDRLLGIVELADKKKCPPNISEALCRAAIEQVAAEAATLDFHKSVDLRRVKIFGLVIGILLCAFSLPWLLVPQAGWNSLLRWALPGASLPRYTLVMLVPLPSELIVPHGEPFEIECALKYHSGWRPASGNCRFENQPSIEAPVVKDHLRFRIPGQTQKGILTVHCGDSSMEVKIQPTLRPELKTMLSQVWLPDYLGYPILNQEVRNGSLSLLEGSRVLFKGEVSRELSKATMGKFAESLSSPPIANKSVPLLVKGAEFSTDPLDLENFSKCAFHWQDRLGMTSTEPWDLSLQWQKDQPPQARCPELSAATAILEDEVLEIKLEAEDDYGIRELGMTWDCFGREQDREPILHKEDRVKPGAPQEKKTEGTYRFCPAMDHVPADSMVIFCATASDYFPGREPSKSPPHRIYVLSREEHARLLEKQFENHLAQLEELTRKQETLNGQSRQTRDLPPERLSAEATGKDLEQQSQDQAEQGDKLADMVREWTRSLREALRNPDLSREFVQKWAPQLQKLSESAEAMKAASESLGKAGQNSQERAQKLEEAMKIQREILKALQEMQKGMGEDLDEMLSKNLSRRLRRMARFEKGASDTLQKMLPETIGKRRGELTGKILEKTDDLAQGQNIASKDTQMLKEEIERYFQHSQLSNYGEVFKEMNESRVTEGLAGVSDLIHENIGAQAMSETRGWVRHFNEWADKLGSEDKEHSSGGMGGGSMGEGDMQKLLEMMRKIMALSRLRQQEEDLRDRTQRLEEQKANNPHYQEESQELASTQRQVEEELQELQQELSSEELQGAGEQMKQSESLLSRPQTDQPVITAQNRAIEQLSTLLQKMLAQAQGMGAGRGMGLILQMMGMGNGQGGNGGGNPRHMDSNMANGFVGGNPNGAGPDARSTPRASGGEQKPMPVEFRDALQGYYHAIEQTHSSDEN